MNTEETNQNPTPSKPAAQVNVKKPAPPGAKKPAATLVSDLSSPTVKTASETSNNEPIKKSGSFIQFTNSKVPAKSPTQSSKPVLDSDSSSATAEKNVSDSSSQIDTLIKQEKAAIAKMQKTLEQLKITKIQEKNKQKKIATTPSTNSPQQTVEIVVPVTQPSQPLAKGTTRERRYTVTGGIPSADSPKAESQQPSNSTTNVVKKLTQASSLSNMLNKQLLEKLQQNNTSPEVTTTQPTTKNSEEVPISSRPNPPIQRATSQIIPLISKPAAKSMLKQSNEAPVSKADTASLPSSSTINRDSAKLEEKPVLPSVIGAAAQQGNKLVLVAPTEPSFLGGLLNSVQSIFQDYTPPVSEYVEPTFSEQIKTTTNALNTDELGKVALGKNTAENSGNPQSPASNNNNPQTTTSTATISSAEDTLVSETPTNNLDLKIKEIEGRTHFYQNLYMLSKEISSGKRYATSLQFLKHAFTKCYTFRGFKNIDSSYQAGECLKLTICIPISDNNYDQLIISAVAFYIDLQPKVPANKTHSNNLFTQSPADNPFHKESILLGLLSEASKSDALMTVVIEGYKASNLLETSSEAIGTMKFIFGEAIKAAEQETGSKDENVFNTFVDKCSEKGGFNFNTLVAIGLTYDAVEQPHKIENFFTAAIKLNKEQFEKIINDPNIINANSRAKKIAEEVIHKSNPTPVRPR